jgi:hypothetical protein
MTHEFAEKLSAALGLLGSLLLALPFFVDFRARQKRVERLRALRDGTIKPQDADLLRSAIEGGEMERILSASALMGAAATAGAGLLVVSFLVLLAF